MLALTYVVMALYSYDLYGNGLCSMIEPMLATTYTVMALHSCGIYGYCLYSYGLYSHGLCSMIEPMDSNDRAMERPADQHGRDHVDAFSMGCREDVAIPNSCDGCNRPVQS